jgi:uncharacterized membrane protein YfcA
MTLHAEWGTLLIMAVALIAVGALSGFLAGLFGIGGGAVVVIILFEAFSALGVDPGLRMHLATGTSLAVLAPTSYSSFRAHYARGAVDMDFVWRLAPAMILGVVAGIFIAKNTGGNLLKIVWIVMGSTLALRMAIGRDDWRLGPAIPKSWFVEIYATFVGLISSLMSIGGGAYMTLLMTLYGRPLREAVATSSAFGPLIAIPAMIGFAWAGWGVPGRPPASLGYVSLIGAAIVTPAGMLAAPFGAKLAHHWPKRRLELAFGLFMSCVVLRYLASFF